MNKNTAFLLLFICSIWACNNNSDDDVLQNIDYRQEMRDFVIDLSEYAKSKNSAFIIIPQNGQELATKNGEAEGFIEADYLNAIQGIGREDLFYGYDEDNMETPQLETEYIIEFLDIYKNNGIKVLVTDYCYSPNKINNSYIKNQQKSYISFAAPERELNIIPDYPLLPFNDNSNDIHNISQAKNFLYLLNPENFSSKEAYINALSNTNYDVLIIDCFYNEVALSPSDISSLKTKKDGERRLTISYMSIGEAEDYRYYWQPEWFKNFPDWIVNKNPDWPDNYIVKYWEQAWQEIIFGSNNAYLDKIIQIGFDGVYLDIIDAFEFFEMYQ